MSDNRLLLAVNFLGVDKLSGSIRNIVAGSKAGAASLKAMKAEARGLESELKDVRKAQAGGTGNLTALIDRERELERAIKSTNLRFAEQKRRIEQVANFRAKADAVAEGAGAAGSRATLYLTTPLTAFGIAAGKAAIDAEELQSAFNVTFAKNADVMNRWAMATGNAMGRSIVEMKQAANTFGIFFNQAAPADKAAAMSREFAVLAQDLGSFFNTDTQTAIDKLRSGLSGESEPLRDFGVFLTEANVKAKALAMGLKPVSGELTEQQKIMARYALILDATKNAQGDVARTSESTANRIRASQAAWSNLQVVVGEKLIPALTPLIAQLAGALEWFGKLSPATQGWIVKAGMLAAALGPVMLAVSGVARAFSFMAGPVTWLMSASPMLISTLGMVRTTVMALGGAFLRAGVMMLANPMVLAIMAVVAAAALLYLHWDKVKAGAAAAWNGIKSVWNMAPDWMKNVGKMMMDGLLLMLNPVALAQRMLSIAKAGIGAFKNFLGIKSPSRLMMQMGGHMTKGLSMGLDRGGSAPLRSMSRLAAGVGGAAALGMATPALAAGPGAARASAAPTSAVTYNVTIQLTGADASNPRAAAQAIKRELDALLAVDARGEYADV